MHASAPVQITIRDLCKEFAGQNQPALKSLNLDIRPGEIMTLLGPSGCGKTTALRLVAGFTRPDQGEIRIGDRTVVSDTEWVPPEDRHIGMVFQDLALFPHLNIFENVAFGLKGRMPAEEIRSRVEDLLEKVDLHNKPTRYPHEISGGQQQRVALARALAPEPRVLLLDEPFSSLDAPMRKSMAQEVCEIIRNVGITALFVTHDQVEALTMSDRIAVMESGLVVQTGDPREVYNRPATRHVASFIGRTNILDGVMEQNRIQIEVGEIPGTENVPDNSRVHVSIRPEICRVNSGENGVLSARVDRVMYCGDHLELLLSAKQCDGAPVMIYAPVDLDIHAGDTVHFDVPSDRVVLIEE